MIIHSPIISGSLTFAEGATFTMPDNGIYSGSFSGSLAGIGDPKTFSASIDSRLDYLETDTGSQDNRIDTLEAFSGSINTTIKAKLNQEAVVSGSSQVSYASLSNIPAGIVSGSSQIDVLQTTNFNTFSSSVATTFAGLSTDYNDLQNIPVGIVSGSSQITISSTTGYSTFSSSVDSRIETEKGRVDAILSAADADKDSFAEIVSLINSVDTTNDNAFAAFYTSSNSANSAQDARLSAIESATGSYETVGRGIVSGSSQLNGTRIDSAELSGSFSGSLKVSKLDSNIIPSATNTYDLGSPTAQFRHVYISSGSLYVNGVQTISTTANDLVISTDNGQSLKLLEQGSDDITLQTADGNIQLKSSGQGDIIIDPTSGLVSVRGTLQIQDGNKITSSGGNNVVFADDVIISGSLTTTSGTINGVNISTLNSTVTSDTARIDAILSASTADADTFAEIVALVNSVDTTTDTAFAGFVTSSNATNNAQDARLSALETKTGSLDTTNTAQNSRLTSLESATGSYETIGRGIVSGSSQVSYSGLSSIPAGIVSGSSQITYASISSIPAGIVSGSSQVTPLLPSGVVSGSSQVVYTSISSIPAGIVSGSAQVTPLLPAGSVSGSSQVTISDTTGFTAFSSSLDGRIATEKTRIDAILSAADADKDSFAEIVTLINSVDTTNDTAFAAFYTSSNSTNSAQDARLVSLESATGSYETKGRGIVSGSAQITLASTTGFGTYINQAVLTTSAVTFASVSATGDVVAYSSSDRRLKDNIKNIENPIEKVQQLNGVTWEWNSNADELQQSLPTVGVIAQEVEEVLPQLVHDRENGYKGVDYAKLTGLLIEAIKEQQKQIDELKSKLK